MNSLFGGLGNTFLNASKAASSLPASMPTAASQPNILMQAMGAALRGESPQDFIQNLARTHPQLRQYDLSNLQQAAQQVCQQNGVDMQQTINQLDSITDSIIQSNHLA